MVVGEEEGILEREIVRLQEREDWFFSIEVNAGGQESFAAS